MTTNRIDADIPAATTRPRSQAMRGWIAALPRDAPRNAPTAELSTDIDAVPTDPGAAIRFACCRRSARHQSRRAPQDKARISLPKIYRATAVEQGDEPVPFRTPAPRR